MRKKFLDESAAPGCTGVRNAGCGMPIPKAGRRIGDPKQILSRMSESEICVLPSVNSFLLGSLRECQAALALADVGSEEVMDLVDHLGACLHKLTRA